MTQVKDKVLGLLGLALRGSNLAPGELPVEEACRGKKARLVLVASNAAGNTARRTARLGESCGVPVVTLPWTKEELGFRLGRSTCAVVALTDRGLAAQVAAYLAQEQPELAELAQALAPKKAGNGPTAPRRRGKKNKGQAAPGAAHRNV